MKQRIITAVIGIIIIVPIILYGSWPFYLIAYLLGTIALFELVRMYRIQHHIITIMLATIFLWLFMYPQETIPFIDDAVSKFDLFVIYLVLLLFITVATKNKFTFTHASLLFVGTIYVGMALQSMMDVRILGLHYFLFVLFTVWATDSGAYFIGRAFGKRKLWPDISPNKTIGGALGGICFAIVLGIIFYSIYPLHVSIPFLILSSTIISIVSQIGDLVASAMKRHFDIKDFGHIFPGHGGVLDRIDSLVFTFIILHIVPLF